MAEPQLDTSAGRLVAILESFVRQSGSTPALRAWEIALRAQDTADVLQRLADLIKLIHQARAEVAALPEDESPEFLLEGFGSLDQIIEMFSVVGAHQVSHFAPHMSPEVLRNLHFCSIALRRLGRRTPTLTAEAREDLLGQVRDLIDAVLNDGVLRPTDKAFLIKRLRDVEAALLGYFIGGFEGVEEAFAALVGTAFVRSETQSDSGFWDKVVQLVVRLRGAAKGTAELASAAETTFKAIETFSHMVS